MKRLLGELVRVIKPIEALYFDGYCQQPVNDLSIGQIGEVEAVHYDDDYQITDVDVRFEDSEFAAYGWFASEQPITSFVVLDKPCSDCSGVGGFPDAGVCPTCEGWGKVS